MAREILTKHLASAKAGASLQERLMNIKFLPVPELLIAHGLEATPLCPPISDQRQLGIGQH